MTCRHRRFAMGLASAVLVVGASSLTVACDPGVDCNPAVFQPGADLSHTDQSGKHLEYCDLTDIDFYRASLVGADLSGSTFQGTQLVATDLTGARLRRAQLDGANINGADLLDTDLYRVHSGGMSGTPSALPDGWRFGSGYLLGPDANLTSAQLAGSSWPAETDLSRALMGGADLSNANLARSFAVGTGLYGADLSGADLRTLNFTDADLRGATLAGADLSEGSTFTNANLAGVDVDGADFSDATFTHIRSGNLTGTPAALPAGFGVVGGHLVGPCADLSGADLHDTDFTAVMLGVTGMCGVVADGANFAGATFAGVSMRFGSFSTAMFDGADLTGADLTQALFSGASLVGADLTGADLTGADMRLANFSGADLTDVDMTGARLTGATLTGVVSSGITGTPAALPVGWIIQGGVLVEL